MTYSQSFVLNVAGLSENNNCILRYEDACKLRRPWTKVLPEKLRLRNSVEELK